MSEITLKAWERSDPVALSAGERDALGQMAGISVGPVAGSDNRYTLTPDSTDSLDQKGRIHLRPDLTWWEGRSCVFVGDAKYKKIVHERIPNADLYQLLAYAIALDLPGGLLIYAQSEAEPREYRVSHADKRLEVAVLDISGTLEETLARVKDLSEKVIAAKSGRRRML